MIRRVVGALALFGPVALVLPAPAVATTGPSLRYIVTLAPGVDRASLPGDDIVTVIDDRFVAVELSAARAEALRSSPAVTAIEPDGTARAALTPDDPCWSTCVTQVPTATDQWGLKRIGAELAWDVTTGAPSVVVAVIDSGVRTSHIDLVGRVLPVIVDPDLGTTDEFGHGTEIAGLIAASGNDGQAIAGMGWNIQLRSYKVLDSNGDGFLSVIAAAINRAVDDGVRIINLSLTTSSDNAAIHAAIQNAVQHGVLVVAAAGNSPSQIFPASYDEVLAVTATGHNDQRASFANAGPWVDIAAPGVDVVALSAASDDGFKAAGDSGRGTSFAVPLVTGTAALMWSQSPSLPLWVVRLRLTETAQPVPGSGVGAGMLDAASAVRVPGPSSPACPAPPDGWILDGYGGIHRTGAAPQPSGGPYWPGWDIARSIAARPDGQGVYVLDGFGAVHLARTVGTAPASPSASGYWPGWDIARDIVVDPIDSTRGWVLDGFGGLHPFGGAPAPIVLGYHPGVDSARSVVVAADGQSGYIASRDGTLAPWALPGVPLPPRRYTATTEALGTREVVFARGDTANGAVLTGTGAVLPLQGPPCWTGTRWPFDIGRAFAAI